MMHKGGKPATADEKKSGGKKKGGVKGFLKKKAGRMKKKLRPIKAIRERRAARKSK